MHPFGPLFARRRVKEHNPVLPKLPEMFDQRGMGDEFFIPVRRPAAERRLRSGGRGLARWRVDRVTRDTKSNYGAGWR